MMCKNCISLKVSRTYTNTEELTSLFAVLNVFSYHIQKWLVKLLYVSMMGMRHSLLIDHTELFISWTCTQRSAVCLICFHVHLSRAGSDISETDTDNMFSPTSVTRSVVGLFPNLSYPPSLNIWAHDLITALSTSIYCIESEFLVPTQ